jgi:tetratricopeptide (TPR) repeat protein
MLFRALANACFAQGVALLQEGSPGTALSLLSLAARLQSSEPEFLYQAARAASALGDRDRTALYCERALRLDPSQVAVHQLLADSFLHGEHYQLLLKRIHLLLQPRTYVEIGVSTGDSIRLAASATLAIGIDPEPAIAALLPPNVRIFRQASDAFFERGDVQAQLGGLPVDLAFIDGMHHFEFALRDFMNLERLCAPASTILIHDCFPHDRLSAERERHFTFWSGDIWRLILLLKKYRPELAIHTVATPPTGLAIVRNLNPSSRFIADNVQRLCDEFLAVDYSYLAKDRAGKLNLFPNDWSRVSPLLAA